MLVEKLLAGLLLAACAVMLLRLIVGGRRRAALDAAVMGVVRRLSPSRSRRFGAWRTWRQSRQAARQAEEVIRRARNGKWEGNVYRPDSFRRPRKPH